MAYLSRELRQTFIEDETALSMANSILFYQQSSRKKKGTIAMIAGTKAQAVIAVIGLNYEIQFLR
jgi:hypothetical protein